MISYKSSFQSFIIIACVWFAAFASLYSDALNSVALYVALPIAFIISFIRNGCRFTTNKYMKILVMLYAWCLLACVWATYMDIALRQMRQILGLFIIAYIFAVNAKDKKLIPWLYGSYIVLFASAWLYAKNNILMDVGDEHFRLNDEKLNANTMAYYLFYVTFLIYVLGEIITKPFIKQIWYWVFWLMLPLSFVTALLTASRQILLIQVPLISYLLYLRYLKGKAYGRKLLFIVIAVLMSLYYAPSIIEHYNNSYLAERNEKSIEDDGRKKLLYDAIKVGAEYFPLGVGPGNYVVHSFNRHFSHNTYTELWANVGIVGLVLYCWLIWLFVKTQWYRYKRFYDDNYLSFLIFGVIFAFDSIFYVFYNGVWLMPFFILIGTHSEAYYNQTKQLRNEN